MPLRPIDAKTPVVTNQESSRLREQQKANDAGQGQFGAQQVQKGQEKFETVKNTDHAEGRVIRKEDQENEKKQSGGGQPPAKHAKPEDDEKSDKQDEAKRAAEDLTRGGKIDIKA